MGINSFDLNNFKIGKNYALEASAGTGKTYNIIEIVKKLSDSGIDLKQILIVTYTEKAAEELKNRIRLRIPDADIENAEIGTIHSFCKRMIEEFCIAAGKPSQLPLIDESDAEDFAKQYIRTKEFLPKIENVKRFAKSIGKELNVENTFVKKFCAIANNYYLDNQNKEVSSVISLDSLLPPSIRDAYDNIIAGTDIRAQGSIAANALETLKNSTNPKLRELYDSLAQSKSFDFDGNKYNTRTIKAPQADIEAFEVIKQLKTLYDKKYTTSSFISYVVYKNAADFYKKWQNEKSKKGVQTYNDMIRSVREEVVNNGMLLSALKRKFRYAIIDEFQDTNQKQWDLFSKVFLSEDHNIIVVGDPKQSIYSFQGSDIFVYESAKKEIEASGGEICSLSVNYRASEGIVESANKFFDHPGSLSIPFEPSTCGKKHLRFSYKGSEGMPSYWVRDGLYDHVSKDESKALISKAPENEKDKYARIVCQTILDCCAKNDGVHTNLRVVRDDPAPGADPYDNVSFRDFVVLARKRKEMSAIKRALEKSGIPYIQYKDNSVFTGIECANWIAVLDAVAAADFSGKNRSKFRKALYTRFFGYSLKEINYTEFDKDSIDEIRAFESWRTFARDGAWESLILGIIDDTQLEKKLNSLNDLRSLGIFRQVGEYCMEYLNKTQSLDSLIISLKKLQKGENDDEDDDSSLTEVSTDFDCVKLMTIHASKGLEFPVVISVAGFGKVNNQIDLYNFHSAGRHVVSFDNPKEYAHDEYNTERREELKRLFYVAYTRAKYVLMLPDYEKFGEAFIGDSIRHFKNAYKNDYRPLADSGKGFDELKAEAENILSSNTAAVSVGVTEADQRTVLKEIISGKKEHSSRKHAYSSLSHHKEKAAKLNDEKLSVSEAEDQKEDSLAKYDVSGRQIACCYDPCAAPYDLSEDFPKGAGLGNAIHEVFELIDYSKPVRTKENEELINACFAKEGFGRTCRWLDDVYGIVESVLAAKLPVIRGADGTGESFSLSELSFADRKNEIEFNFNKENEKLKNFFNGFIDLIIKRGDYYLILDWKSDRLREEFSTYSDGGVLKNHIDDLYSIQRVLYSYTLIKWLENFYKGLTDQEIFEQHFGGVYYVCIRGCNAGCGNGIYAQTWESFSDLEQAYDKIVRERVGA